MSTNAYHVQLESLEQPGELLVSRNAHCVGKGNTAVVVPQNIVHRVVMQRNGGWESVNRAKLAITALTETLQAHCLAL